MLPVRPKRKKKNVMSLIRDAKRRRMKQKQNHLIRKNMVETPPVDQVNIHKKKMLEELYILLLGKTKKISKSHKAWSEERQEGTMTGMVKGKRVMKMILEWTIEYQKEEEKIQKEIIDMLEEQRKDLFGELLEFFGKGRVWQIVITIWKEVNNNAMKFIDYPKLHEVLLMTFMMNVLVKWKSRKKSKLNKLLQALENWRHHMISDADLFCQVKEVEEELDLGNMGDDILTLLSSQPGNRFVGLKESTSLKIKSVEGEFGVRKEKEVDELVVLVEEDNIFIRLETTCDGNMKRFVSDLIEPEVSRGCDLLGGFECEWGRRPKEFELEYAEGSWQR